MATNANNARREEWERAFNKLTELNQSLNRAQPRERDAIERALAVQEEDVLDTPAPSFGAVLQKLYLIWHADLFGLDAETEARRLVLEDLERLIREAAQLLATDIEVAPDAFGAVEV